MVRFSSTKTGQVWFFDFMIAVLIFVGTLTLYFNVKDDATDTRQLEFDDMIGRSKIATSDLMSEGYPTTWNSTNVTRIGLMDAQGRFDALKIQEFYSMGNSSVRTKLSLGPVHLFLYLARPNGTVLTFGGMNQTGEIPTSESMIVQTTRLGVYGSDFVQLKMLAWREP
jgi:hypothetical protein